MKRLFAGPLPPDAPKCSRGPERPTFLGGGQPCPSGVIISAFTVELADGRTVAWLTSESDAIYYAGWYVCSWGGKAYVMAGGKAVASVEPKATCGKVGEGVERDACAHCTEKEDHEPPCRDRCGNTW